MDVFRQIESTGMVEMAYIADKRKSVVAIPDNIQYAINEYKNKRVALPPTKPGAIELGSLAEFDVIRHKNYLIYFKWDANIPTEELKRQNDRQYIHNICVSCEYEQAKQRYDEPWYAPESFIKLSDYDVESLQYIDYILITMDGIALNRIPSMELDIINQLGYDLFPGELVDTLKDPSVYKDTYFVNMGGIDTEKLIETFGERIEIKLKLKDFIEEGVELPLKLHWSRY